MVSSRTFRPAAFSLWTGVCFLGSVCVASADISFTIQSHATEKERGGSDRMELSQD